MRKLTERAIKALPRQNAEQIKTIVNDLVEGNKVLETVLSSLPAGIMVSDINHDLLFINTQARRFLKLSGNDFLEKKIWKAVHDKDISDFIESNLLSQERVDEKDFNIQIGDKVKTLALSILPLVDRGTIKGSFISLEDVTEKRAESLRLRRAESLASLTTLAAGVAHEIKNPLGSISIHIQLMQKCLNAENDVCKADLLDYLNVVNEEVDRLNQIVVNYLFAVRPMDTDPKCRCINSLIEELIEFIHFELEQESIEIIKNLEKDLPELKLDDKLIKQAFLNIIKNAQAAMKGEAGLLKISTFRVHDSVAVSIADTGPGIPEELKDKIFEPYFTTKDSGSGLGLTLVYKIMKEHSAEIRLNSIVGEGTNFTFIFPIPQKEQRLLGWDGEKDEI
ncbi:MAG: PAS domain-containing protein [Spirochaetaceae bacterium]|nr:PAS domain-containing protein [Spirochaetaceae bacterium]